MLNVYVDNTLQLLARLHQTARNLIGIKIFSLTNVVPSVPTAVGEAEILQVC